MCKGMDDWAAEIAEEAGIRASIEAWQDANFPMEDILSRLEKKYHLTEAAARCGLSSKIDPLFRLNLTHPNIFQVWVSFFIISDFYTVI